MKKENIYVEITNETERLRAINILQNTKGIIWEGSTITNIGSTGKLTCDYEEWNLPNLNCKLDKTKITLDELEALLNPKKSNVFTDVQEWIRENMSNVTYTFQGNETPDCFKRLEQHLINDYPKGTEIKISKDKIEIYHS
jgi:hypothetical protein